MTHSKPTKTALKAGIDYTGILCVALIPKPKEPTLLLLLQRSLTSIIEPGLYELPSSNLEFQDTPLECICNGIRTQTTLIINPYHQAPILTHITRGQHWLQIPYLTQLQHNSPIEPNLRLNKNYNDHLWTTPQNALKKYQLTRGTELLLNTYVENHNQQWKPRKHNTNQP